MKNMIESSLFKKSEFSESSVTPFRLCECGCGEPVHGKARLSSAACRKRVQRQRDAAALGSPKQFNLVLQSEIPVTIPRSRPPRVQSSEISEPKVAAVFPWADCDHSGYISLAQETPGFYCAECENLIYSDIPAPPERLGYLSAVWKDWEKKFPHRYPNKVRSQFSALPFDDEEKDFLKIESAAEEHAVRIKNMKAALAAGKGHWPKDLLKHLKLEIEKAENLSGCVQLSESAALTASAAH